MLLLAQPVLISGLLILSLQGLLDGLNPLGGDLVDARDVHGFTAVLARFLRSVENVGAFDDMNTIGAGHKTAHLIFGKLVERIGVLGHERAGLIPTHIAAVFSRGRVLGVLLRSFGEIKLAGVDLVQNVLRSRLIIGVEQDMGGTLRPVISAGVHLGIRKHVVVARIAIGRERRVQILRLKLQLKLGTIVILGHAGLLKSGFPLLVVVIVVGLHLVNIGIDLGAVDGDALLVGTLLDQLARDVIVDDLLAQLGGSGSHLRKILTPGILISHARLATNGLDVVGDGALVNVDTVDRRRDGIVGIARAVA